MKHSETVMNVAEVMKHYRTVWNVDSWNEAVSYALNDKFEKQIINNLIEELERDGRFRNPIHLHTEQEDEETIRYVSDGTHRLIAAYIYGAESISVIQSDDDSYVLLEESSQSTRTLYTEITIPYQMLEDSQEYFHTQGLRSPLPGEAIDPLMDIPLSFPLHGFGSIWLNAEVISSTNNGNHRKFFISWEWDKKIGAIPILQLAKAVKKTLLQSLPFPTGTPMTIATGMDFSIE